MLGEIVYEKQCSGACILGESLEKGVYNIYLTNESFNKVIHVVKQ